MQDPELEELLEMADHSEFDVAASIHSTPSVSYTLCMQRAASHIV